jgi:hypothetical protein
MRTPSIQNLFHSSLQGLVTADAKQEATAIQGHSADQTIHGNKSRRSSLSQLATSLCHSLTHLPSLSRKNSIKQDVEGSEDSIIKRLFEESKRKKKKKHRQHKISSSSSSLSSTRKETASQQDEWTDESSEELFPDEEEDELDSPPDSVEDNPLSAPDSYESVSLMMNLSKRW